MITRILSARVLFVAVLSVYGSRAVGQLPTDGSAAWDERHARVTWWTLDYLISKAEQDAIEVLTEEEDFDARPQAAYAAIQYLGRIRSKAAISVLCDRLVYEQKVVFSREPATRDFKQPAIGALIAIGEPVIEPLIERVAQGETTPDYRDSAMIVLVKIVGRDKVGGRVQAFREKQMIEKDHRLAPHLDQFMEEFSERFLGDEDLNDAIR